MALNLHDATILDGTGADPFEGGVVRIADGRIVSIGEGGADGTDVDLAGLTLLPGLIDAHAHHGIVEVHDADRIAPAILAARIIANLSRTLDEGFTTTREMGGLDGGFAGAVADGLVRGPRLFPSGPLLCTTAGHGDLGPSFLPAPTHTHDRIPGLVQNGRPVDGADAVRAAAREAFRHGATQLKLCISGGVVSLTDRMEDVQFSVDEMRAAVEEAEARHTYVAAHAHNTASIRRGLEAGIRSFEHGTFLDEDTALLMLRAGAVLVPTLTVARRWMDDPGDVPPSSRARIALLGDGMDEAVRIAHRIGLTMGSGSDLVGPVQQGRGEELVLKAALIGGMAAIVSATRINAEILGIADRLGTVESGKVADLIAIDGDPLADPGVLADPSRVVLVVKDGVVVKDIDDRVAA